VGLYRGSYSAVYSIIEDVVGLYEESNWQYGGNCGAI
jgi:hypothetical protein